MKLSTLKSLNLARSERRAVALLTDIETGTERLVDETTLAGDPLAATIAEQLRKGKSTLVEYGGRRFFLTIHVPPVSLVMVGAVHISQALVPLARLVGFEPVVVDPRTAFATPERFPDVRLIAEWPDIALPPLNIDRYTAFAALTHDPKIDDPGLAHALARDCFYVGALGSRKTHAKRVERLRALGLADAAIARIHAPIGLDIGAISPAEIAVSIVAEITAALRLESGEKRARAA
jgi:xanthine dehydrogenase accessory factor